MTGERKRLISSTRPARIASAASSGPPTLRSWPAAGSAAVAVRVHAAPAYRAHGHPGGAQALPYAVESLLEREPAAVGAVLGPLAAKTLLEVEAFAPPALADQGKLPAATACRQR